MIPTNKQVYAMNNYEELVYAKIYPKSDPSSDAKIATYTTNVNSQ